jgi:hypothetical protein
MSDFPLSSLNAAVVDSRIESFLAWLKKVPGVGYWVSVVEDFLKNTSTLISKMQKNENELNKLVNLYKESNKRLRAELYGKKPAVLDNYPELPLNMDATAVATSDLPLATYEDMIEEVPQSVAEKMLKMKRKVKKSTIETCRPFVKTVEEVVTPVEVVAQPEKYRKIGQTEVEILDCKPAEVYIKKNDS